MWLTMFQVALGGALGAAGRYLTGIGVTRLVGSGFPSATLTVNVVGSFVMGVAVVFLIPRDSDASRWVPFVMTGVLGGFTTFSAFSLDVFALFERGRMVAAAVYIGGSVGASIAALIVGIAVAKGITG